MPSAPRHSRILGHRRSRFSRRRVDGSSRCLNALERGIALHAALLPEAATQLLGAGGNFHEHRINLWPQDRRTGTQGCHQPEHDCQ